MAAAAAAGGGLQIVGNIMSANAKADAMENEAQFAEQNAITVKEQAAFNANKQQIAGQKKVGAATAGYAASGVDTHMGSAADVLMQSAANAERDRLEIIHSGDIKALMLKAQAAADRQGAESTRMGGYFGAAGQGISTGASIYGRGTSADAAAGSEG